MCRTFLFAFLFLTSLSSFSQEIEQRKKIINFNASYIGDQVNNLAGGLKTGSCYQGMANIRVGLNTGNAKLWKNGEFFFNVANTHGANPTEKYIGDYQGVSNIEAGNHTYLQEMWYRQVIGFVEITAGLQDLNIEFANSEQAGHFLNSSFGILPTISGNIPAPIFPLTSLGLSVKWNLSDRVALLTSLYDGCPTDFEDNPYNLKWEFKSGDGTLFVSELQYSAGSEDKPATIKTGMYFHQQSGKSIDGLNDDEPVHKTNYGMYIVADQVIWNGTRNNRKAGMFLQLGLCPENKNQNYYYTGIGFNYFGLLNKQGEDVMGISVAHVGLDRIAGNETSVELTYKIPFAKCLFLQPDFQYVINPSGSTIRISNSFVATVRFGINL